MFLHLWSTEEPVWEHKSASVRSNVEKENEELDLLTCLKVRYKLQYFHFVADVTTVEVPSYLHAVRLSSL